MKQRAKLQHVAATDLRNGDVLNRGAVINNALGKQRYHQRDRVRKRKLIAQWS